MDLASNDYLGLAHHQTSSRAVCAAHLGLGRDRFKAADWQHQLHEEFESELAAFTGAASALVFSSGYTANLGAVTALSGPARWWSPDRRLGTLN